MKIQREIAIHRYLSECDSKIVKLLDSWYDPASFDNGIIMNFYDSGTVTDCYLFGESDVKKVVFDILESLSTIHDAGIIHGDVKEKNILLMKEHPRTGGGGGGVVFIDFGMSYHVDEEIKKMPVSGTPLYMAPEVWTRCRSSASDIWSVGVIAYRMLHHGNYPFVHSETGILRSMIRNNVPSVNHLILSKNAVDFLSGCLRKDPMERLTLQDCLNHPWFG